MPYEKYGGPMLEKKSQGAASCEDVRRADSAFFRVQRVTPIMNGMNVIRILIEILMAWIREVAVGLSGRATEEFLRARLERRRKRRARRKAKSRAFHN